MFVAKWALGIKPEKPSLSTVLVWLNFTGVPLQFFNKDALKEIAGLVDHPLYVHPATENLTNIEVARVYTVIDPRKPLPEAVNAQFESGEITRIKVTSPWLPSLCSHCRKVGHTISKCPSAPPKCSICNSPKHDSTSCPRNNHDKRKGKAPIVSQYPIVPGSTRVLTRPKPYELPTKNSTVSPSKPAKGNTLQWVRADGVAPQPGDGIILASDAHPGRKKAHVPSSSRSKLPILDKEKFCIDLRANIFDGIGKSSASDSAAADSDTGTDGLSNDNDDDSPDEERDRFIEVISNRKKKLRKAAERARGPLNL